MICEFILENKMFFFCSLNDSRRIDFASNLVKFR